MARILIIEHDEDLERLYAAVMRGLGHDPVLPTPATDTGTVDVVLVEPAHAECRATAGQLRAVRPDLPIVCASLKESTPDVESLEPIAYLVKPFTLVELTDAVEAAVARTLQL